MQLFEESQAVGGAELLLVVVITALGGFLRLTFLGDTGLSHFDEGVYVLWGAGIELEGKELFAPPLFPLLLRAGFSLFGPSDVLALSVSGIMGTLTIPLIWWIGRRWYGPGAGVCSAAIAAFSGYHITFSRIALTDTTFTFFLVLSFWLASEMISRCCTTDGSRGKSQPKRESRAWPWAVAMGLATGAAMNTKYNGFLIPLLAAAALVTFVAWAGMRQQATEQRLLWGRAFALGGIAVGVALSLYLPWFLHVSSTLRGGYAQLISHQRGYSTGLSTWPDNFLTLLAYERWLCGGLLGCAGPVVGVIAALALKRVTFTSIPALVLVGIAASLGFVLGEAPAWLMGIIFVAPCVRATSMAGLIHLAWLAGFFVVTPFYHPYPRLLLPLLAAGWIAAGGAVAATLNAAAWLNLTMKTRRIWLGSLAACIIVALVVNSIVPVPGVLLAKAELSPLKLACDQAIRSIPPSEIVAAFVRPPVLFYVGGQRVLQRIQDFEFLQGASSGAGDRYLLVDVALLRDNPTAQRQLDSFGDNLRLVAEHPYQPGASVLLDDFGRDVLSPNISKASQATYRLVLYRITNSHAESQ